MKVWVSLVLLASAFVCCASAQSEPPIPAPPKSANGGQSKADSEKGKPSGDQATPQSISSGLDKLTSAVEDGVHSYQENSAQQNAPNHWWTTGPNIIIAAFTGVLAIVAWLQWQTYERQAELMKAGLAETKIAADAAQKAAKATEDSVKIQFSQQRHGSVFWIAQRFENQAGEWADRPWNPGDKQVMLHNTVIHALSPYVDYVRKQYPIRFAAIQEAWTLFHGGNMGTRITLAAYIENPDFREKDFWVNQLFIISAHLRAVGPDE